MSVITKVEIAAKCSPTNNRAKDFIQLLPKTLTFELYKFDYTSEFHTINFEDKALLENKNRYALILTKGDLNWLTENVRSVSTTWINEQSFEGLRGRLCVFLSSDDRDYDHVLTDVRHNNQKMEIPGTTYSVCSCISDSSVCLDVYITVHVE